MATLSLKRYFVMYELVEWKADKERTTSVTRMFRSCTCSQAISVGRDGHHAREAMRGRARRTTFGGISGEMNACAFCADMSKITVCPLAEYATRSPDIATQSMGPLGIV